MITMVINMLNLFVLLGLLSKVSESATLSGISTAKSVPNESWLAGSYDGGTSLYFHADFLSGDPSVYKILVGSQSCDIIGFNSDSSTLECRVPPSTILFPNIVEINMCSPEDVIQFGGVSTQYNYNYEEAPWILYVNPTEACPGDEIAFVGRWGTYDFTTISQATIGTQQLSILDDDPTLDYWGWYNVSAVINDNVHGDTTPSIFLAEGHGNSIQVWIGTQYTPQGSPFDFRTLARIDTISNNQGSAAGGLEITITGAGFPSNHSLYSVLTDGQPCEVTFASPSQVVCTTSSTSAPSSDSFYQGNAGLVREYWQSSLSFGSLIGKVYPDMITRLATPQIKLDEDVNFRDRMYGLFVAPVSGDYTFYVSSDDYAQVFLSADSTPTASNAVPIINFQSWTELKEIFRFTDTISQPITLAAGQSYYLEAWHTQFTGGSHFELGVEMPGSGPNKAPFVQRINIVPTTLVREVQTMTIGGNSLPTGGILSLKYGTTTLGGIYWDAGSSSWHCSDIVFQLNNMGLGQFLCNLTSDATALTYQITFNFPLTATRPLIAADSSQITPSGTSVSVTKTPGTRALSGNYTASYQGNTGRTIAVGDWIRGTERDLNIALNTLNSQLVLQGYSTGDEIDYYFILPYTMVLPTPDLFTIDVSQLLGGQLETSASSSDFVLTPTVLKQPGDTVYFPVIPSDFLRNYEEVSQLTVDIDGVRAVCRGNCSFVYMTPPTYPSISSVTETSGQLTIVGGVFQPGATSVVVGFANCAITSITDSQIVCTVPLGPTGSIAVAGTYAPTVYIQDQGIVASTSTTTVSIPIVITGVAPSSGSTQGGTEITITGTGFLNSLSNTAVSQSVVIGTAPCTVTLTSVTSITCITSAMTTTSTLTVTIGSTIETSTLFTYDPNSTPSVTRVSVSLGSTITTTPVSITGTDFGTNITAARVWLSDPDLGEYDCVLTSISTTDIECTINGGPNGVYTLGIYVDPYGYASIPTAFSTFELVLEINSISASTGSTNGGTLLTITGNGFSLNPVFMTIFISNSNNICEIQPNPTSTSLTCITPPLGDLVAGTSYDLIMYGRLTDQATCNTNCKFTYSPTSTPTVTSISTLSGAAGASVTFTGSSFGTVGANVFVYFGDAPAAVTAISDNSMTVTVPSSKGVSVPITMSVAGMGIATTPYNFTNGIVVSSVQPNSVSKGGSIVTINGSGFDEGMSFKFGSTPCTVITIADSYVTCTLGSYSTNENSQLLGITGTGIFTCSSSSTCGVTFNANKSFSISSYTGNLSITGSFPSISDLTTVTVNLIITAGTYNCAVTSITSTTLVCIPNAPAGTYSIQVYIENYGFSTGTVNYNLVSSVSLVTAPNTSYGGGMLLQLTGIGLYQNYNLTVCGFLCTEVSASGSSYNCTLPPLPTTHSQSTYSIITTPSLLTEYSIIASSSSASASAFDGDTTTYFTDSVNANVYIGIDAGSSYAFQLSQIKFMGGGYREVNYQVLVGMSLQGSNDNSAWAVINTFISINNFWNTWSVPANTSATYRYYRLSMTSAPATFAINEIQFYGIRIWNTASTDATCGISLITSATATIAPTTQVSYKDALSSALTSITPNRGTSAGGVSVTFAGTGFGTVVSNVNVIIDDVPCVVLTVSNTQIVCTTGARPNYVLPSLQIMIANSGYVSTKGMLFLYSELWSDTRTWGGEVPPRAGELVVVPPGMNLVLDMPTPLLAGILIEGALIVNDIPGITIDAYYIFVYGGTFQIGTEEVPFLNDITITIHGNSTSPALPNYGNKFIAVRNGVLDIHGNPRNPSWSLLAETANINDNTITLQDSVNWQIGEQVIIATTSYVLEESEVMTIASTNGAEITFTAGLKYKHYAATETYGSSSIDMRAEVGLLTRNIKICGSDDSLATQYGVHVMLFSPGNESSVGRIENLEIFHAGQAYNLGRYPLHFHLIGDVTQSYIRNNSIHDTFNRATTVHGVYYLTIEHNVAYNTMGHTYFIEDGIEQQNTFYHNLGVNTRASFSLLNLDQTPATFWITNPTNFILNNHAAGSESYGFWYSMTLNPTGPSATATVFPEFMALGQFQDNTAHSVFKYGLRIFHRFFPSLLSQPPIADYSQANWWNVTNVPVPALLERFTAWKCQFDGAIGEDLGDIRFIDFKLADNIEAGIELTYTDWTQWYHTTRIQNAMIIGNSGNSEGVCNGTIGLLGPQTDGLFVDGANFFNFNEDQFPLGDESHSWKHPTRDLGARITKLQGLTFTNSHRRICWGVPQSGIFEILDDSLTGSAGVFVAASHIHLQTPECQDDIATYNATVCTPGIPIRRIGFYGQVPWPTFSFINATIVRADGLQIPSTVTTCANGTSISVPTPSYIPMQKGGKNKNPEFGWNIPLVTGYTYSIHWGDTPIDWTFLNIEQQTFESTEFVILSLNFTDHRENFTATRGAVPATVNTTAADFVNGTILAYQSTQLDGSETSGTFTWDNVTTRTFNMTISGVVGSVEQWGDISVTAYRCYGTHCSDVNVINDTAGPVTIYYWSNVSTWPSGALPVAGDYVEIPMSWHLYLDTDTEILHQIDVNGVLEFSPSVNASLHANWIFVRAGSIVSGSVSAPTPKNVTHSIVLHGNSFQDSFAFSPYVEAGNKVLVVTGNMSLHGYPKVSITQLEQNAYPGDNIIFVEGVDWEVGDIIVVSPSGFNSTEFESFTIIAISGVIADFDQNQAGTTVEPVDFSNDLDWKQANNYRNNGRDKNTVDHTQTIPLALSTGITKITLNSTLTYFHSGVTVSINGYSIDLRTEVALLNRNVKITTEGNGWAATTVVNDFVDTLVVGNPVLRAGFVDIEYVQFDGCGQLDTNLGCLRFESVGTNFSYVAHSVFSTAGTWSIYFNNASNTEFTENVIFNARWRGVVATNISSVTISYNTIIGVSERGYVSNIFDATVGFHICSDITVDCSFTMLENSVLGCDFVAYVVSAEDCNSTDKVNSGNYARSSYGGFMLTNSGGFDCAAISGATAHFTQEGLGFKSSTDHFLLGNLEFVENIVGMSMRTGNGNQHQVSAILSNSVFVGQTIYSDCQNCNTDLDCNTRWGYIFGDSDIGMSNVTLTAKIMLPMYQQAEESNILGTQTLTDLQFMNYNYNPTCVVENFAMVSNPDSPDYQLPQFGSRMKFANVGQQNLLYMFNPNPAWLNPDDCVDWNCTGPLNAILFDQDGSITGFPNGGVVLANNPGIAKKDICTLYLIMNAYFCSKDATDTNNYMILEFESMDIDNKTRTFSPVTVTSYASSQTPAFSSWMGGGFRNDLANFQDHTWDGFYTGHIRYSRFPTVIYSGQYYNITTAGTPPNSYLFRLQATNNIDQPIIVAFRIQDPSIWRVYINNVLVPPIQPSAGGIAEVQFTDPHGTNRWFSMDNTLQFILRNETAVFVQKTSSVSINMEMDMTIDQFYNNTNPLSFIDKFAAMLGIPSYRVTIATIKIGSVIAEMNIQSDPDLGVSGTTTTSAQLTELNQVLSKINTLYSSGAAETQLGVVIMNLVAEVDLVTEVSQTDMGGTSSGSSGGSSGNSNGNGSGNGGGNGGDNSGGGNGINPTGENINESKNHSNSFQVVAEDWVIGLFAGILFLIIIVAGLIIYKQNANKNIQLHEISPSKISALGGNSFDGNPSKTAWVAQHSISPPENVLVSRQSFTEEKKQAASSFSVDLIPQ